jgi:nitrate reductase gamma subunit
VTTKVRPSEGLLKGQQIMPTNPSELQSQATTSDPSVSRRSLWIGRILTGLAAAFMLMDAVMKLFKPPFVVKSTVELGFPESTIVGIGVALLICTILYIIPRTAVFGAVLVTGYLGGAVAANVRAETAPFNIFFPIVIACIVWTGLWLRNPRLRLVLSR